MEKIKTGVIYKRIKNIRLYKIIIIAVVSMLLMVGCGKDDGETGTKYAIYYLSEDELSLVGESIAVENEDDIDLIYEFTELLKTAPDNSGYHAILDEQSGFIGVSVLDGQATFDFTELIVEMPKYRSVLIRAALAKTYTQLNDVSTINCTVNGQPMLDSYGNPIGTMTADSFMENEGTQINPDEQRTLTLYFASEDGNRLVPIKRTLTYSGNISMEKLVVEQLIAGPNEGEKVYPVVDNTVGVIGVTTQDGVCYVNLSSAFLTSTAGISSEVVLYSIVDSLVEIENINKVQFMIEGESNILFRENIDLSKPLTRNLDILE